MIRIYTLLAACLTACSLTSAASDARAADPNPPTLHSTRGAWTITRQWTPAETRHYAKWVEQLYLAKVNGGAERRMAKLEQLLTDPEMNLLLDPEFLGQGANPQAPASVLRIAHNVLDCGKLTAFLPAYYAYRRGLPWMFSYVRPGGPDPRTAPANIPSGQHSSFNAGSLTGFFADLVTSFGSGNYRVEIDGPKSEWSDSVPVAIDPACLMPGCVMYTDGHCLMLAHVTPYGELYFINASMTDTRDIYTYNGMNVVSGITPKGSLDPDHPYKGCFQGLRVFRYPIAQTDASGCVTGVRRRTDAEMREFGFSTEQYELINQIISKKHIDAGGLQASNFHDYIRLRMKTVDRINPLDFMEAYADELVQMFELREQFVQDAWREYQKNGPITYPEDQPDSNIFQAHGRWETWSSPSSDVDRRNKYFYLKEWLDYAIRWYGLAPGFVDISNLKDHKIRSQADLLVALIREKRRIFDSHHITYSNSAGEPVELTLTDIETRIFELSFDPNHPPELRWGAPPDSPERATAPETVTPVPDGTRLPMLEAYRLEAYYRTVSQRETEPSYLRAMFTDDYPIRDRIEEYLIFLWGNKHNLTPALEEHFAQIEAAKPKPPPPPPLVPAGRGADPPAAWNSSEG